jgi:hypothetical protein
VAVAGDLAIELDAVDDQMNMFVFDIGAARHDVLVLV